MGMVHNTYSNGSIHKCNGLEVKLNDLRGLFGKANGDPLRIVSIRARTQGSVFAVLL